MSRSLNRIGSISRVDKRKVSVVLSLRRTIVTAPAVQPDVNQVPVPVQMLQIITNFWTSRVVGVFAKLGISDLLQSGPMTAEELAEATGTHAPSLFRVL